MYHGCGGERTGRALRAHEEQLRAQWDEARRQDCAQRGRVARRNLQKEVLVRRDQVTRRGGEAATHSAIARCFGEFKSRLPASCKPTPERQDACAIPRLVDGYVVPHAVGPRHTGMRVQVVDTRERQLRSTFFGRRA